MRKIAVLVAFALVSVATAADDPAKPPSGWKEYSPKDKSFTVWLPEKGKNKEDEATIHLTGGFVRIKMARVEQEGGLTYSAGVLILPLKYRKADSGELMVAVRDSLVKEIKGKVAAEKEVKQGKVVGKEYSVETGQGITRLRLFVADGRIYRAEVAGSKEQVVAPDADKFLDSYKLPARVIK